MFIKENQSKFNISSFELSFEVFVIIFYEIISFNFIAQQITTKTDLSCFEKLWPIVYRFWFFKRILHHASVHENPQKYVKVSNEARELHRTCQALTFALQFISRTHQFIIFSHTQWVSVTLAIRLCPSSSSSFLSAWTFLVFRHLLSNRCTDLLQILCGCSLGGPLLSLLKSGCYPYFSWNYG